MIFIAERAGTFLVRAAGQALYDRDGRVVRPGDRRVSVTFRRGGAPAAVVEAAARHFEFRHRGLIEGVDPEPVEALVCWVDTVAYATWHRLTDEERATVEHYLETSAPGVVRVLDAEVAA